MARACLNGHHTYITRYTDDSLNPLSNRIIMTCKCVGYTIIDKVDKLIASSEEGYFLPNDDTTLLMILERCFGAVKYEDIVNTLKYAVEIGYYDKRLLDEERIFTSREAQKMHFDASINRQETYILAKYSLLEKEDIKRYGLVKKYGKLVKTTKKVEKSGISTISNEISSLSLNENSLSLEQKPVSYLHKVNKTKVKKNIIKRKEREIKKEDTKLEENSDSESYSISDSNYMDNPHLVVQQLLNNNLLNEEKNILDIQLINSFCFGLNKQHNFLDICKASKKVISSWIEKNNSGEEIGDAYSWFTAGMEKQLEKASNKDTVINASYPVEENENLTASSEAEELEKLKEARRKRKERNKK